MEYAPLIKEIGRGARGAGDLPPEHAYSMFGAMLDGRVPELELGAIVLSMRIKSESLDEIIGFKQALDERTRHVAVPAAGPRCVVLPSYNGARRQPNLMPLVALLLQRHGVPVLIQGRNDFDGRESPFELLAALDVPRAADTAEAAALLAKGMVTAIGLESLCPGLAALLALRPRLGVRSSGHTMAKLLDPCPGRSVRVVPVTHPEYLVRMHQFLSSDGGHALLMRGTEGEAYANPRRRPKLECYFDGTNETLFAAEEGGAPPLTTLPNTGEVVANVECIRSQLAGRLAIPHPILDQTAALLYLSGRAATLAEGQRLLGYEALQG